MQPVCLVARPASWSSGCPCGTRGRAAGRPPQGGSNPSGRCPRVGSADHSQGGRLHTEGHRQLAPELAVDLDRDVVAGRVGVDLCRLERLHGAVEGPAEDNSPEDVWPEEGAHALYEDGFEPAAGQEARARHPVVAAVVVAVGDYGEPRDADVVARGDPDGGEPVAEEHPEGSHLEGEAPQVALLARRHLADDLRVEADARHAGEAPLVAGLVYGDPEVDPRLSALYDAPAGPLRVQRQPEFPGKHVRRAQGQDAEGRLRGEAVYHLVHRAVAAGRHHQALPGLCRELRSVVRALRVQDLHKEAARAQGLCVALEKVLVACAPGGRVPDDHSVRGRSHAPYYSPFTGKGSRVT